MNILRRETPEPLGTVPPQLNADLDTLFVRRAPTREFRAVSAPASHRLPARMVRAGMVAAVALLLVAMAGIALPLVSSGGPERVSAQGLLAKSESALARLESTSYYVERQAVLDGGSRPGDIQVSRLWSRDTEHWRMEIRTVDPATGQPFEGSFSAQIRNGDELWMVIQDGENLRVINRSVKAMGFEQVGFSLGTTLEETLAHFKICEGGATASDGDAVAGRSTFRIDCAAESASVWVDKEWFVPLKHELKGRESISSTTVAIDFGPISDDVFDYHPPSGTRVNYQDRGEVVVTP